MLDGIVVVVDALHAQQQLDRHPSSSARSVSPTDCCSPSAISSIRARLSTCRSA
jgi:hypothetical protein